MRGHLGKSWQSPFQSHFTQRADSRITSRKNEIASTRGRASSVRTNMGDGMPARQVPADISQAAPVPAITKTKRRMEGLLRCETAADVARDEGVVAEGPARWLR